MTLAGLLKQGELNIDVLEQDAANKLATWFKDRWEDQRCIDISNELIEIIDNSWATDKLYSPYHIYLKIAYHLAREARAGLNEFKIPKIIQNTLLNFQEKAVLIAAHYLNKRDGVLIGDVVGLGKTLTATALARGMRKRLEPELQAALDANRLLIIAPFNETVKRVTAETAFQRNRLMAELADEILIAYASKGGSLEKLTDSLDGKRIAIMEG